MITITEIDTIMTQDTIAMEVVIEEVVVVVVVEAEVALTVTSVLLNASIAKEQDITNLSVKNHIRRIEEIFYCFYK